MDANGFDPYTAPIASEATDEDRGRPQPLDDPCPSLLRSMWRGAKTGFRRTSYVTGPIAAVMLIPGLAFTALGVGAGRGWPFAPGWGWHFLLSLGTTPFLSKPFIFYIVSAGVGAIVGAAISLILALIRRTRKEPRAAGWWAAFNRPIRLLPGGRSMDVPIDIPPARNRRRRWPWLIGVPVMLMLAIAFGVGTYLGRMVDQRLAAAIAAADRDDLYWRVDDLMAHREPVPDEENSALVVAEVLSMLPEHWPDGPKPPPGEPKPPRPEAMKTYDRLTETADNVRLDDAVADTLRSEMVEYDEAVRIARTVADHDRGRHELELGPTLIDTLLPETQAARTVARLLAADATILVHDGDPDGALDSGRAILGVGRSIGDEPFLISQLVRLAIGGVAMKSTRRVLGQGEPSDEALACLQALVLDELSQPLLLHGLKGERATLTELIRRIGAGELPISALSSGGSGFDPDGPRTTIAPWGKLMFDNQRAIALEWMNEAVAIARRPADEWPPLWKAWDARINRVKQSRHAHFTATLPLLLMPALSASHSAHSRTKGELGATAILLAAERHRRKSGDWPTSIAAIDPGILPSPPLDPFSGQAFRMERRDGQLLIFSIGPNGKDEHGAYEPKRWMRGGADDVGTGAWDVPLRRQRPPTEDLLTPAEGDHAG